MKVTLFAHLIPSLHRQPANYEQVINGMKLKLILLMREGRHDAAARIQSDLLSRVAEILGPGSNATCEQRIAACHLLPALTGLRGGTAASQIDLAKCLQLLHHELESKREVEGAEVAALTIGRIVCSAGLLAPELIEAELSESLLHMHENDPNLFSSILVFLRIVQNVPSSSLLNAHCPILMESIWNGLFAEKLLIRERAAELLSIFLGSSSMAASTSTNHSIVMTASPPPQSIIQQFRQRARQHLQTGLSASMSSGASAPLLHGMILLIGILVVCDPSALSTGHELELLNRMTGQREALLRTSAIKLIPRLLPHNSLDHKWLTFLLECIRKDRDRPCVLTALSETIKNCQAECFDQGILEAILTVLKPLLQQIPSKLRKGDLTDSIGTLDCVACLAEQLTSRFRRNFLLQVLPVLLSCPLWPELITALSRINAAIPETIHFAEDTLIAECKAILLNEPPAEVDRVLLAIRCLGAFPFTQCSLAEPLGLKLMQVYLNDPRSPHIRADTAELLFFKCRELKYDPGFKTTNNKQDSGDCNNLQSCSMTNDHADSQSCPLTTFSFCPVTKWIVRGVVAAVTTRMVADDHPMVAERILNAFVAADAECLLTILAHPDCIRPLFTFLSSNNAPLQLRILAATVLGRVASHNQPALVPCFRKLLLQYLSEIECLPIDDDAVVPSNTFDEPAGCPQSIQYSSARLLQAILEWPACSVAPYVPALLRAFLPRLKNQPVQLIECFLSSLSRLVAVEADEFIPHLEKLLSVLTQLIADLGVLRKRKAGLAAAVAVLRLIDRSAVPLDRLVALMNVLVDLLKTETDSSVRREAVRLMGIIGAIDPYTLSEGEPAGAVDHLHNGSLAIQLSRGDEFFAGVVVESLLKILKDSTLTAHHLAATQALGYLIKTLGVKAHIFLPAVMPALLGVCHGSNSNVNTSTMALSSAVVEPNQTQSASPAQLEFYFNQLAGVIRVVGVFIRPFVAEIVGIVEAELCAILGAIESNENLAASGVSKTTALLHLVDVLAYALKGEFRPLLPRLLPPIFQLLQPRGAGSLNTFALQKALQTLAILGPQLGEYAGIVGDTLVLLLRGRTSASSKELRISVLRVTTSLCKDVTAIADNPAILQSLTAILRDELAGSEVHSYCMDAVMVVALAQGRDFFRFLPALKGLILMRQGPRHLSFFDRLWAAKESLNSPAKMADLTVECLRVIEVQLADLTQIDGGGVSGRTYTGTGTLSVNTFARFVEVSGCGSRDDWMEWLKRFGLEMLRASPSPSLRACSSLANVYQPLARELFNVAFAAVFPELPVEGQSNFVHSIQAALVNPVIPSEVVQVLLNLAEFMERQERPLPIDVKVLGTHAARYHAFAKALYYKEQELLLSGKEVSPALIEALISINNQIGQPDAALGVLVFAHRDFGIALKESWYEKLQRWDQALKAYESRWQSNPASFEAMFGILRCRHALGEWDELNSVAGSIWDEADGSVRKAIAPVAAASAWGLHDWKHLQIYLQAMSPEAPDSLFFQSILAVVEGEGEKSRALQLIDRTRDQVDTELAALLSESYSRAYNTVVRVQLLSELEEIALGLPEETLKASWQHRLSLAQPNVEVWLRVLKGRSLIFPPTADEALWIKFAGMCRKNSRPQMAQRILLKLLGNEDLQVGNDDRSILNALNLNESNPQVIYAYLKFLWEFGGDRLQALRLMKTFARFLGRGRGQTEDADAEALKLLAQVHYKWSKWEKQLITESTTGPNSVAVSEESFKGVLDGYMAATSYDKSWHKAWHEWALTNFELSSVWERNTNTNKHHRINPYIIPAIQGFFRSISLSSRNSLQDSLRVLTLWFKYGGAAEINAAVGDGFYTVPIENWLQVIPQLIARIHVSSPQVRRLVQNVLGEIGKHHPQALVYPLSVAAKSQLVARKTAAVAILDKMRSHSAILVDQAMLVGQELIRVAILWEEMWHEGLEEASKFYFGEHNIPAMFGVLEPLHQMVERGSQSIREALFIQSYGQELKEARDLGNKYKQTGQSSDLNAAWDLYYQIFRRINKALPPLTYLDLESSSPRLLNCKNLQLAVPGTYRADQAVIRIVSVVPKIEVIASKQRPRKLVIIGSDGQEYQFLLKGHEDLRQDERVMQFFGLINTLLLNDPETHKRHLSIERFSVIPLSQNTGLIGWLPHCDTMHTLIKDFREARGIPLSLEHRAMLAFAPDYDHLTKLQKVECFTVAMDASSGTDLARVLWLKSKNAESWFERRLAYARSLAVMSVVGYVLGLGDRHPSNLMIDQVTGRVVHIDFGDCFEVAMQRERFPEQVPFRLTRMLVRALEVAGWEGTFRITSEETMRVLRSNKDSLMAVLEAFVYDPLINWRLLARPTLAGVGGVGTVESREGELSLKSFTAQDVAGSWAHFPDQNGLSISRKIRRDSEINRLEEESLARPEALNSGAISVINRVSAKLTGRDFKPLTKKSSTNTSSTSANSNANATAVFPDFSPSLSTTASIPSSAATVVEWPLSVHSQVDRLIGEASRIENLCQAYVGWCPFW